MTTFPNAPWSIDPEDEWSILDKDGDRIADVSAALYKPGQGDLKITNVVYARQVRELAIAAPDLLEALEFLRSFHSGHVVATDGLAVRLKAADAAISKAKGGQS